MRVAEIVMQIETEMLQNLANLLMSGRDYGAEWQFLKLRQLGILTELNAESVRRHREALLKAVRDEIEFKAFERAAMVDRVSRGSGKQLSDILAPKADPALVNIIRSWERSALVKIQEAQSLMISGARETFQESIAKAAAKVQMGVTGRQAMAEICEELAETGLHSVIDASGRTWSLEGYAQMAIRSSSTNAAVQVQWERMDELGNDLIEVSSHVGARPKCAPYQGRVYSRSGASSTFPSLSSTSYGEPDGLFGINCRHVAYPYFPGTKKTYETISAARNEKAYAEEQKQRSLERDIRKAKLAVALVEKSGDEKTIRRVADRLAARKAAIREFTVATGRKRQYARERVYGTNS